MKRSRLIRATIASLLALPLCAANDRAIRRSPQKEPTPVLPISLETNNLTYFAQPVTLTPVGIKKFLRNTYNHHNYALEFLPNNFSHLMQFLRKGKESHQKRAYVQSVFRLFSNKLKGSSYVNAYAFSTVMDELPVLLADYFTTTPPVKNTAALQVHVNEMLYSRFLSQFKSFKDNPVEFLDSLSHDIVSTIDQQEVKAPADPTSAEELRKVTLMFLDTGLSRLIWNPGDLDETWRSVKKVAQNLGTLFDHEVIVDQDDLNDLFRTLIERYCLFLDIAGENLPVDFFDRVKQDIQTQSLLFLDLEEEEDVESKSERLMRSLVHAQQKAICKKDPKRKPIKV
jgi:hypothetical protein